MHLYNFRASGDVVLLTQLSMFNLFSSMNGIFGNEFRYIKRLSLITISLDMILKTLKVTIIIFFLSINLGIAQDMYAKSAGVRGGPYLIGVNYKHFLAFAGAIEGIAGFNLENGRIFAVTGLYEHHIFLNYNTNLYVGGGLTLGANSSTFRTHADVIAGIEYLMERFPISVSFDYKPAYNIFGNAFYFNEFAISVRYIIN